MIRKASLVGNTRWAVILLAVYCLFVPMTVACAQTYALQFDGVDDHVDIGPWPELTSQIMAQPVTYEYWLSSTNTTDTLTLIGAVNTGDSTFFRISLNMDGMRVRQAGGIKILQRDAGGVFFRGGTASNLDTGITNGEWHHMALVFDANTGSLAIYVDGVSQELSFLDAATPTNVTDFEYPVVPIGARNVRGVIDQNFQGLLNEMRIWNYARTESEIQGGMNVAVPAGAEGLIGYWPLNEGQGTTTSDNSGSGRDGALVGPTWTTEAAPVVQPFAFLPVPADGAVDVPRDIVLGWSLAEDGQRQNLYLGADPTSVSAADASNPLDVLLAQDQTATTYAPPGGLQFGRTYYWRIDEVGGDSPGRIWSFTVEPTGYALAAAHVTAVASSSSSDDEGPQNTVDGSGLDPNDQHSTASRDMWLSGSVPAGESAWIQYEFDKMYSLHQMLVWNHNSENERLIGFGIKEAIVEHSLDGQVWTALSDSQEFGRATGQAGYETDTAIDLGGAVARYVRITAVNSWGGLLPQYGLSEVRFLSIPMAVRAPQPADAAVDVGPETVLSWRAGREAAAHDVYLGTGSESLELVGTTDDVTFAASDLQYGRDYYWRVDEVNEMQATPVWAGDLWNFATQEFAPVDDFESYDDEDNAIYDTWLDGWVNETGSTVGYLEAPFAERSIVHGGRQSMPLTYDNAGAPFYSEAEYELGGMDWDVHGADTLRLFVSGQAPAFFESSDGSIFMNAIGDDIWNAADQCRYVYKSLTGDGSLTVRVDYLDGTSSAWAKGGVMVRQNTEASAVNAFVAMTGGDGGGAAFQQRLEAGGTSVSQHTYDGNPFAPPYWVRLERAGSAFSAFISPDGETWQQAGDTATVAMTDPVLVGLVLTSHNAGVATSAEFSNISTTGNVVGSWQVAEIGLEQPTGGNDPERLYVAIEDSAGHVAVVTHAAAATRSGWTEWLIPYGELAGVNVNSVRRMLVGLGDRNNPSAGGAGLIFIDDIGFGHPAAGE